MLLLNEVQKGIVIQVIRKHKNVYICYKISENVDVV